MKDGVLLEDFMRSVEERIDILEGREVFVNKVSEYWYNELHDKFSPMDIKEKLTEYILNELNK